MDELRLADRARSPRTPGDHGDRFNHAPASQNASGHPAYVSEPSRPVPPSEADPMPSNGTPLSPPSQTRINSTPASSVRRLTRRSKQRRTYSPSPQVPSTQKRKQPPSPSQPNTVRGGPPSSSRRKKGSKSPNGRRKKQPAASRVAATKVRPATILDTPPPHLFDTRRQHRPEIWQFIKLSAKREFWHLAPDFLNEHAEFEYCTRCKVVIPFRTANHQVVPHMEKVHPAEFRSHGSSRALERNLMGEFSEAADELREITKDEQEKVNMLLAKWIAEHFRPMVMIEDEGFIEFVEYISQTLGHVNVPLPKRTQLRRCVMILANDLHSYVKREIDESCEYYSITADIWTARNGRSYIAFTIHYVDADFNPQNWTLEVKEIPGKHTGTLIASYLDNIMSDWGLDKDRCTRFVRDSGSNMVSAGKILGVEHVSCLAHDINLVVSGAMSKDKIASAADQTQPRASAASEQTEYVETEREEDEPLSEAERSE